MVNIKQFVCSLTINNLCKFKQVLEKEHFRRYEVLKALLKILILHSFSQSSDTTHLINKHIKT